MRVDYLGVEGDIVSPDRLTVPKAKDLARLIRSGDLPYVCFREARSLPGQVLSEIVVLDVEVERPQRVVNDIRRVERISVTFKQDDNTYPEVLALRDDFPKVPHLNLREKEFPRSLCLYAEPYTELKLDWTPIRFIECIRQWLARTARGELHEQNQPLEPLFFRTIDNIVIPYDLFTDGSEVPEFLIMNKVETWHGRITLKLYREGVHPNQGESPFGVATAFKCFPQTHGVIYHQPSNLLELCGITSRAGFDLLKEFRGRLTGLLKKDHLKGRRNDRLALIIFFPKKRFSAGEVEISDIWGFLFEDDIGIIGTKIGIWEIRDGHIGSLLRPDQTHTGEQLKLTLLSPVQSFSRDQAAHLNGLPSRGNVKITAIGLGATGSHIFINLIRGGFGEWTLIDDDILLPHNLARHALAGNAVGLPKAWALEMTANLTISGVPISKCILDNVLDPKRSPKEMENALKGADVILDATASVAVARYLSHDVNSASRRISVFLSPSGRDLVMMGEPEDRAIKLDFLEMQYYRFLINNVALEDHLRPSRSIVRYSNSCGDISSTISQNLVSLHSSIASGNIQNVVSDRSAKISIWKADTNSFNVEHFSVVPGKVIKLKIGGWMLYCDNFFIEKIYSLRSNKLPNETGGVLIGSYDMERKIIYVIDTLPSPPDSEEWPTVYIRGCRGLKGEISRIKNVTLNRLTYVGEWHAHPEGSGWKPSQDDHKAFCWLAEIMDSEGLPALMLIAGDRKRYKFFLGEMR
jgi:integrative and conjugative element protein (TIGR02256 family)